MEIEMKSLNVLTLILVIVGGLNWGLVGLAKFDLVAAIFGAGTLLSNTVYALVGISALYQLVRLAVPCRMDSVAISH
jgi:uncharacterized membrane protein YuzA (DUF378 family)